MGKKLIGIYLPVELIERLKKYVKLLFLNTGKEVNQSEVVEKALTEYLDKKTPD